jgi:uncharacterized membrane protein
MFKMVGQKAGCSMRTLQTSTSLVLFLFFLGIGMVSVYIYTIGLLEEQAIPEIYFWLGTILFSASLVLGWRDKNSHQYLMLLIFVSAFFVASIGFLRFPYYGPDLVGEYFVATTTKTLHRWPSEQVSIDPWRDLNSHWYFSCLSVTVLPSIVSEITGIPMMTVFRIMVPLFSAIAVMTGFLVVKQLFGEKVASLSSIVFIFHDVYRLFGDLLRQDVALIFLFLSLYLIFKKPSNTRYASLAIVFMLMIPTAHYSMVYFELLCLAVMLIAREVTYHSNKLLHVFGLVRKEAKSRKPILSWKMFMLASAMGFGWLLWIAYPIFYHNLQTLTAAIQMSLGMEAPIFHAYVQYVVFSSLGPLHAIVNWSVRLLIITGFFIALKISMHAKDEMDRSILFFSLWGGIMLLSLLIDFLMPNMNAALLLDRVYFIGLLAFSTFVALTITELCKKLDSHNVFATFFVVTMFLATFTPLTYLPESTARAKYSLSASHIHFTSSDLEFMEWIERHTGKSAFFASDIKGSLMCKGFASRGCIPLEIKNSTTLASQIEDYKGIYFILATFIDQEYWFVEQFHTLFLDSNEISELQYSLNSDHIFSNGRSSLVYYTNASH